MAETFDPLERDKQEKQVRAEIARIEDKRDREIEKLRGGADREIRELERRLAAAEREVADRRSDINRTRSDTRNKESKIKEIRSKFNVVLGTVSD